MGMISTVTIGAVSHSVYAITADAVQDADDYLDARIGASPWAAASADDKKRALVSAARWIDRVVSFSGTETVDGQPRAWPRDGATCGSATIADGTVPDDLAYAEFELAFILVLDATKQDSSTQGSNVKSVGAGSASISFFSATTGTSQDTPLPAVAWDLIKCLIGSTIGYAVGLASGIDDDSEFCPDDFDRSEGYA